MNIWLLVMLVSGGLFTGMAMAFSLERVPAWRAMPPPQFRADFGHTIRLADRLQPALLMVWIVTAIGFALAASGAKRTLAFATVGVLIIILVASGAVLVPLQRRIIASTPAQAGSLEVMRRRWEQGHFGRSVLATIAFVLTTATAAL